MTIKDFNLKMKNDTATCFAASNQKNLYLKIWQYGGWHASLTTKHPERYEIFFTCRMEMEDLIESINEFLDRPLVKEQIEMAKQMSR